MKKIAIIISILALVSCGISPEENNSESLIICLNYPVFPIRDQPQGINIEYVTKSIDIGTWTKMDLTFNFSDTLRMISISPSRNDTLCFDTIWIEDVFNNVKTITFESVLQVSGGICYDTLAGLGFGVNNAIGDSVRWEKKDNKTIMVCPVITTSNKTYSAEILFSTLFSKAIKSNGKIKLNIKAL